MKKWQRILLGIVIVGLLGFGIMKGYLYYLKNKPHRDVVQESGIKVTAQQIFDEFTNNEQAANAKYLNKAVEVTGEVAEVKKNQSGKTVVILKTSDIVFGVNCTFKEDPGPIQAGDTITFKGICTGLVSDVVVNEGVLVKK